MCGGVDTYLPVHMWSQMSMAGVFLNYSPPCVLRQSLSVSLEFEVLARPAGQWVHRICLNRPTDPWGSDTYMPLTFYMCIGDQIPIMFAWHFATKLLSSPLICGFSDRVFPMWPRLASYLWQSFCLSLWSSGIAGLMSAIYILCNSETRASSSDSSSLPLLNRSRWLWGIEECLSPLICPSLSHGAFMIDRRTS